MPILFAACCPGRGCTCRTPGLPSSIAPTCSFGNPRPLTRTLLARAAFPGFCLAPAIDAAVTARCSLNKFAAVAMTYSVVEPHSMASLMEAVASRALNRRPPVAASCLARMASMTAFFASGFARLGQLFAFRLEVIHMEAQDVRVLDGVGDGVGVELLLEEVCGGLEGGLLTFDLLAVAFCSKMGVPVKPKSWALGKNSLMALWFSPNCERWHSSKMKTMRLSRSGSNCSL